MGLGSSFEEMSEYAYLCKYYVMPVTLLIIRWILLCFNGENVIPATICLWVRPIARMNGSGALKRGTRHGK